MCCPDGAGQSLRLPGPNPWNDLFYSMIFVQDLASQLQRARKHRNAAQQAVVECSSVEAPRRMIQIGSKPQYEPDFGDWVKVWRRFGKDPGEHCIQYYREIRWVGACVVLIMKH